MEDEVGKSRLAFTSNFGTLIITSYMSAILSHPYWKLTFISGHHVYRLELGEPTQLTAYINKFCVSLP